MKKLDNFLTYFNTCSKKIKYVRIKTFVFVLFFSILFVNHPASAQRLKLVLGTYECISNADCTGDNQYCDIDEHVCRTYPENVCDPDEVCNPDEICEVCPTPSEPAPGCDSNTDCPEGQKCLNRTCVECTGDNECPQTPPHFCVDNVCRSGCTKDEDCTNDDAPECNTDLGICLPCPDSAPYFDTTTRECREICKSNADCKDEMRPFCRLKEGESEGTCGCPDKSVYTPIWQTCAYMKQITNLITGRGRGGYKGDLWSGGGNHSAVPMLEANYEFVWTDPGVDDWIGVWRNGSEISRMGWGWDPKKTFTFNAGDTFSFAMHNEGKDNGYWQTGTFHFVYKDKFKRFSGEDCTGAQPIMISDGRCVDCENLTNGSKVDTPHYCYKCDNGKWFAAHSSKGGTDNVCRPCKSGNTFYYAEQEQCLKCSNRTHRSKDTACFDCAYTPTINNTTKEECTRCPNRRWRETNATTHLGDCYLCANGSEADISGELCSQCDADHPIEKVNISSNGCISCDKLTNGTQVANAEACHKCGENTWYTSVNNITTPIAYYCRPCASGNNYYLTQKEECQSCSNTVWRSFDKYCFDCAYNGWLPGMTTEECHSCDNRLVESNTNCNICTNGSDMTTSFEECRRCPNRYWIENASGDGYGICRNCPNGATVNADGRSCSCQAEEVMLSDGRCFACTQLINGIAVDTNNLEASINKCHACNYVYLSTYKRCYNCSTSVGALSNTTKEECDSCETNRYWTETNATTHLGTCAACPAGTEGDDTGYNCICDTTHPVALVNTNTNGCTDCESLTNGRQVANAEACHKCGASKWYASVNNITTPTAYYCRPCASGNNYYLTQKEECQSCSNTVWRSSDKYCFDCAYNGWLPGMTTEECHSCDNRLVESNTNCNICTNPNNMITSHAECLRCPNRYWIANTSGDGFGTCKKCASGSATNNGIACGCTKSNEVATADGKCILCSTLTEGIQVNEASQCHKCSGWLTTIDTKCYKCDSQYVYNVSQFECNRCGNHLWRSADNTCYQCSYPYKMYNTTKAECDKCPDRVWSETDSITHLGFCSPAQLSY